MQSLTEFVGTVFKTVAMLFAKEKNIIYHVCDHVHVHSNYVIMSLHLVIIQLKLNMFR